MFNAQLEADSNLVQSAVANISMKKIKGRCFQIANSRTRAVKSSHTMEDRRILQKISPLHSLMMTYRMNLISAGSI